MDEKPSKADLESKIQELEKKLQCLSSTLDNRLSSTLDNEHEYSSIYQSLPAKQLETALEDADRAHANLTRGTFERIMAKQDDVIIGLKDSKRCVACICILDTSHVNLCHDCANDMTDLEFESVIRRFRTLGFYPSKAMKLLVKLGLVKLRAKK